MNFDANTFVLPLIQNPECWTFTLICGVATFTMVEAQSTSFITVNVYKYVCVCVCERERERERERECERKKCLSKSKQ